MNPIEFICYSVCITYRAPEVAMKRFTKLVSLVLALAMVLSIASCSAKRRTGAKRIQSDEYAKQEYGMETDYTEPTETDVTNPDPTETEPSATTPSATGNSTKGVIELLTLAESACGLTPDEATKVLASALGLTKYETRDSDNKDATGAPVDRYLRYLDKDIVSEGVVFKNVSMHIRGGLVYSVDYGMRVEAIFAQNEELPAEEANNTMVPIITAKYGDPIPGYTETWVDFNKKGITGWQDGNFVICAFWGKGCQGVTGNDQFVLGVEYKPDANTTPKPTSATGKPEGYTAEYLYVAGILFVGGNQNTSKKFIEATFGTTIGEPVSTDKPTSTPSYTAYTYECNIVIDGVEFNRIEIDVCDSNSTVFQVSFINNKVDDKTLDEYQKMYADKLAGVTSKSLTDKSSGKVKSSVVVLDSGTTIDVGNVKDGKNNSFWVSFYNDNYLV